MAICRRSFASHLISFLLLVGATAEGTHDVIFRRLGDEIILLPSAVTSSSEPFPSQLPTPLPSPAEPPTTAESPLSPSHGPKPNIEPSHSSPPVKRPPEGAAPQSPPSHAPVPSSPQPHSAPPPSAGSSPAVSPSAPPPSRTSPPLSAPSPTSSPSLSPPPPSSLSPPPPSSLSPPPPPASSISPTSPPPTRLSPPPPPPASTLSSPPPPPTLSSPPPPSPPSPPPPSTPPPSSPPSGSPPPPPSPPPPALPPPPPPNCSESDSWNWKDFGAVFDVRNQGRRCNASWAFSAVAAIEGILFIRNNRQVLLSEQQFIDCDYYNFGCVRGSPARAFKYAIRNKRLAKRSRYPYIGRRTRCRRILPFASAARIRYYGLVPSNNENELRAAVRRQPVSVSIDARLLRNYTGGIYQGPCGYVPNHVMTAIGYGCEESSGLKYWILKNSWGLGWGEDGYMRLLKGSNDPRGVCGVAISGSFPDTI